MFLAAFIGAIGGGASLFWGRAWGDRWVAASAELVLLFGALVLVTGPLWAKKSWGHYWVWDVRLTTVLILFLIFIAVLLARRFGGPASLRIAAGLCVFGAADVPLIYLSVKLWRTIHPRDHGGGIPAAEDEAGLLLQPGPLHPAVRSPVLDPPAPRARPQRA